MIRLSITCSVAAMIVMALDRNTAINGADLAAMILGGIALHLVYMARKQERRDR
jgi:hypothetical protein